MLQTFFHSSKWLRLQPKRTTANGSCFNKLNSLFRHSNAAQSSQTIEVNTPHNIYKDFAFISNSDTGEHVEKGKSANLAHVISTDNAPLLDDTFHSLLRSQADRFDSNPLNPGYLFYFHETDEKITYNQFIYDVECTAKSLIRLGVTRGDRVGIWLPNNYSWLRYFYACAEIGAISVSLNTGYVSKETEYCINLCQIKCLIIQSSLSKSDYCDKIYQIIPELKTMAKGKITSYNGCNDNEINNGNVLTLKHVICIDNDNEYNGILSDKSLIQDSKLNDDKYNLTNKLNLLQNQINTHEAMNIQFTSGTTGSPKGCATSHYQLINNGYHIGNRMVLTNMDRYACASPLFHTMGTVCFHTAAMTSGAMQLIPSQMFDAKKTLDTIHKMKATALCGVPTMYNRILNYYLTGDQGNGNIDNIAPCNSGVENCDVTSLRTGVMAGMVCPTKLMSDVVHTLGMNEITICYGMTETSPVTLQSAADTSYEKLVSTCGTVSSHTELKLIDPSSSTFAENKYKTVRIGERGEVLTKAYSVMKGYWCQPDKTRDTIDKNGFVHTGDIGVMDKNGNVTIVDRVKDIIIRGGENIYPKEIEEAIRKHPNVYDIAIVSIPDFDLGEEIAAFIITKDSKLVSYDELKLFLKNELAHYKIPKLIWNINDIPQTASGKIQKFKLRLKAIQDLQQQKEQKEKEKEKEQAKQSK